jgi:protein TonB
MHNKPVLQMTRRIVCRTFLASGLFCQFNIASAQQNGKALIITQEPVDSIYTSVESMPHPDYNLERFLIRKIKYTRETINGRVFAQFTVGKDGQLRDIKIVKSISPYCDQEALRVINIMPPWKPGIHDGKPVDVYFTLPVVFNR